ncbi:DUF58 domain-containing protein [Nocardioides taihuensis]|uniref:DUF58 domain-containing protein n=1 Tax=Nocardioides taihuensis TaxID=1835606 RepID=A0ABW0BFC5_9ACTN
MAVSGRFPLLLLLGLVPVVLRPHASTVWLWLLLVAVLAVADWVLAPAPSVVTVERVPTGSVRLGDPTWSDLRVSVTGGRRVRGVLRDAWQPSAGATGNRHRLDLRPGDREVLRTPLRTRRRGDLRALGVTVRTRGPLGLVARQRTRDVPGRVRSVPPFESRKHLPSRLARLRELDGRSALRVRGQGTEFDSLREYVRGDDVRSIDWRATARNRNVVVRTWQPERDRRVVLVLDTSRTSAGRVDDVPRLDSAMDAALLLAALAARAGDRVDVVAGDRRVRTRLRSAGGRDVAARLQDAMADLEPVIAEADWTALAGAVTGLGRQRALVVLLTPLEAAAVEEGLLPVLPTLTRHHRVVVASVRDPELERLARTRGSLDEVYDAAAAEQALERRRRTAELLRALGVDVVDADAERLPPALADHYLELKASGRL